MPEVMIDAQAVGKTLAEDVHTELGGILFEKGHTITEEDLEYFAAFKVYRVKVLDSRDKEKGKPVEEDPRKPPEPVEISLGKDEPRSSFQLQYLHAVNYMEKLMRNVAGGSPIPVLEIREWLKPLIDQVNRPTGWLMALQPVRPSNRYTYFHSVGVALLASIIARLSKFSEKEIMQIALAGLLADIGKVRVDERILQKPQALTEEEFEEVKQHTVWGYQILKGTMGLSEGVPLAVLQHHEREDGSGYPLGIKGDQIHPYAKIVAIADVFHAMCSLRAYRQKESPFRVLEHLRYENFGRFDPKLVHDFVGSVTQLPLGTWIRLNDGREGKIIYHDLNHPTRPMVEIGGKVISLAQEKGLHIQEVIG